jgi:aminomethyltransferase
MVMTPQTSAPTVWQALINDNKHHSLTPAGGITYNTLRIRSGIQGYGREISDEFIPLEVGLWDEVSFNKGCYKGQEIIARMDSRERVARTIVRLKLTSMINAPTEIQVDGKVVGKLTSSVVSPDDEIFAIGVVKTAYATVGQELSSGAVSITVQALLGVQPAWIAN